MNDLEENKHLLAKIKTNDAKAFEVLYLKFWNRLFQFAVQKIKNEDASNEIVQDIFVDIWERRTTLQVENIESYLFSATKYKIIAFFKEVVLESVEDLEIIDNQTNYQIWYNDFDEQLQSHIDQLPEKTKEIFILNRIEGKTAKEIAEQLQIPERTVEYHITQSLRYLRSKLQDYLYLAVFLLINK